MYAVNTDGIHIMTRLSDGVKGLPEKFFSVPDRPRITRVNLEILGSQRSALAAVYVASGPADVSTIGRGRGRPGDPGGIGVPRPDGRTSDL